MSNAEFACLTLQFLLLIATAHLLGYVFTRLRQPRVVGEILAGVLLGPTLMVHVPASIARFILPTHSTEPLTVAHDAVLSFLYNLGLLLLMFASGAEVRGLFQRQDRREVAWLGVVGTALPFGLTMLAAAWIPFHLLGGNIASRTPLLLVVGIAVAVTSIPVISRILHDLNILHTRFARLVLGVAVMEDIALWAVLAIATALAKSGSVPQSTIVNHVIATLVYFGMGLTVGPRLVRMVTRARWNVLAHTSPVGYVMAVMLTYTAVAAAFDISLVFAAFLAGYAIALDAEFLAEAMGTVKKFSFAVLIPVYFAIVGFRLDLGRTFSFTMLAVFIAIACVVKLIAAGMGSRLAGFGWRDSVNLSMALNARGGPGIVLASVAFDAGIINAAFYTTLVLTAVLTSQAAGAWLEFVIRRGWPLLEGQPAEAAVPAVADSAEDKLAA